MCSSGCEPATDISKPDASWLLPQVWRGGERKVLTIKGAHRDLDSHPEFEASRVRAMVVP